MMTETDSGLATEATKAQVFAPIPDGARHSSLWGIRRFDADIDGGDFRVDKHTLRSRRAEILSGTLADNLRRASLPIRLHNVVDHVSDVRDRVSRFSARVGFDAALDMRAEDLANEMQRASLLVAGVDTFIQRWQDAQRDHERFLKIVKLVDESRFLPNVMLNEGINTLTNLLAGQGSETNYGNANARLGVGESSTAESATQTALQGSTLTFKAMDATYPATGASQYIRFQSTFGGSDANNAWNEFTADNGSTPNKNLNRKVSAQGTKTSGQTWILQLTVTFS
jgi:hypothetical protein